MVAKVRDDTDLERAARTIQKAAHEAAKLHMGTRRVASAIHDIRKQCRDECPCSKENTNDAGR